LKIQKKTVSETAQSFEPRHSYDESEQVIYNCIEKMINQEFPW